MESQVGRAEAQAVAAQEGLTRCRKELEETRKREVRLRDKLRDQLDGDGKRLGRKGEEDTADRYDQLERELELLRTQNLILRRGTGGGSIEEKEGDRNPPLGEEIMEVYQVMLRRQCNYSWGIKISYRLRSVPSEHHDGHFLSLL